MRYQIHMENKELSGSITLPASKSVSNRLLILNALAKGAGKLSNLSDSDDTIVLEKALARGDGTIDIGHAGTAMRFLAAYLSIQDGNFVLTGSGRMKQRPIGKLVDALCSLGAEIDYLENPGFPPLSIHGKTIPGGTLSVDSSISSQYISALMMIGPSLSDGITINLENEIVSSSYINLTKELMLELGIPVNFSGDRIEIPFHPYRGKDMEVEGDWSAAGYWYAIAALGGGIDFEVNGLRQNSLQGDSILPELFRPLGVETTYTSGGILLSRIPYYPRKFEFDFSDSPDLVQTMVVVCGMMELPFLMKGTRTLKIKETDRINALSEEMKKLGIKLEVDPAGEWIFWDGNTVENIQEEAKRKSVEGISIKTYQDHRMAMAFAPAALKHPGLFIEDPSVVHKSYPGFWDDLKKAGFILNELD